jgi:hypothetical protein
MTRESMWLHVEMPVYLLSLWSIAAILSLGYRLLPATAVSALGWIAIIASFGWIGFRTSMHGPKYAAKAGALAGLISGSVSAVMGILSFYVFPNIYEEQIRLALQAGAPADLIHNMMMIGVYMGLVTAPAISAGVGAVLSALVAWISNRK